MCYCCVCFSKQIKLFKKIKKVSNNEDYSSRRNLVEIRYGLMPLWHIMSAMIKIWNMIQDVSTLLSCVSSLSSEHACQHNHAIGWRNNSEIATTNGWYHLLLRLEAWYINSCTSDLTAAYACWKPFLWKHKLPFLGVLTVTNCHDHRTCTSCCHTQTRCSVIKLQTFLKEVKWS